MNSSVDFLTALAALFAIVAFLLSVLNAFRNYLHIDLQIEYHDSKNDTFITALTSVDNKGVLGKQIEYALLLIGPEEESPIVTAKRMALELNIDPNRISFTNDISVLQTN